MNRLILASASPRRIEMMKQNGYEPEVVPANIEEHLPHEMSPEDATMYLAAQKARHVCNQVIESEDEPANTTIIAADTVVVYKTRIIGKPANADEAFSILSSMKNDSHHVITGVCIINIDSYGKCESESFYSKTTVFFKDFTDEEILEYVATPEPYDKAGGYAIQGTFGKYVDRIDGSLNNVIGFPWEMIEEHLKKQ